VKNVYKIGLFLLLVPFLSSCVTLEGVTQPKAKIDPGIELPAYAGPKASIAVGRFTWKVGTGGGTTVIRGVGEQPVVITHEQEGVMSGLRDMLTTALIQSGRYRVMERQELAAIQEEIALAEKGYIEKKTAVERGKIKGADLLIVAAITGWDPGVAGTGGGVGVGTFGFLGGITGAFKKSHIAMDIRIIDMASAEVLAATRIEGEARDVALGGLLGGLLGNVVLGGALGGYSKTPMEKAIRICIYEGVKYIITNTPHKYYRH